MLFYVFKYFYSYSAIWDENESNKSEIIEIGSVVFEFKWFFLQEKQFLITSLTTFFIQILNDFLEHL